MLLKQLHILWQLHALGQPLGRLRHRPVVHLRASPSLPQLTYRNVHVVVEVKHPVPVLVARIVLELLAQELCKGYKGYYWYRPTPPPVLVIDSRPWIR